MAERLLCSNEAKISRKSEQVTVHCEGKIRRLYEELLSICISKTDRKYSHTESYNFAITVFTLGPPVFMLGAMRSIN